MVYRVRAQIAALLFLGAVTALAATDQQEGRTVAITNGDVIVRMNLDTGQYDIASTLDDRTIVEGAGFGVAAFKSADPVYHLNALQVKRDKLLVEATAPDMPTLLFEAVLNKNRSHVTLRCGLINATGSPLRVKTLAPLIDARSGTVFEDKQQVRFLNGEGGDGVTRVHGGLGVKSVNNLLLTFLDEGERHSLVLGGLVYEDFAKYAQVGDGDWREKVREEQVAADLPEGYVLRAYLNLSDAGFAPKASLLQVAQGNPFRFPASWRHADPCYGTVAYHPEHVVIEALDLAPDRAYALGFSWWDYENWGVAASVEVETPAGWQQLTKPRPLPAWQDKAEAPENGLLPLPAAASQSGIARVRFSNQSDAWHVLLSEVWLAERHDDRQTPPARHSTADALAGASVQPRADAGFATALWAEDPVGRLVEPGETYFPSDSFYIDAITQDPFAALEAYGLAMREANHAHPKPYSFPTVCGWYEADEGYGNGPHANTTAGMVAEAEAAAQTGFLRYAPVAVRLVPDDYGIDNQQGWWDDAHWRRYGHYVKPYDTTASFASAVKARGAIPLSYLQPGLISKDYALSYPEHLLFDGEGLLDKPFERKRAPVRLDYTDPSLQEHLAGVYANLREGGVMGLMFDYPERTWCYEGGFEDDIATTASAYRLVYALAREGLGDRAWLHERLLRTQKRPMPMTDMAVGLVDSQRVWGDTDGISPDMYARCGLRWYKNRVLWTYDMDAKNLNKVTPDNLDGLRQLLTMTYVTGGRLLLSTSFEVMTPEQVHALSRIYPMHPTPRSARPIDIFTTATPRDYPRVFDFAVTRDWHQVTLFNNDVEREQTFDVSMDQSNSEGGLGLAPLAAHHVYDFWNDIYAGLIAGGGTLSQTLRPGEARMLSVRRKRDRPQVLSTNRHVMQGYVDLHDVRWLPRKQALEGMADLVAGEPFEIAIALNGFTSVEATSRTGHAWLNKTPEPDVVKLVLYSKSTGPAGWRVSFTSAG